METIDLSNKEHKVYSQNGEDGVIEEIFFHIHTTNKFYVEFGAHNGIECNTRLLRERHQWSGLLMDKQYENQEINLHRCLATRENIIPLLIQHNVPVEFDLLSIDIDFNDFYVLREILCRFTPRVIVCEYNATHGPEEDKVVRYNAEYAWDGTNYFGSSLLALYKLCQLLDYVLIYAESTGVNAFFVRKEALSVNNKRFIHMDDVTKIYRSPGYGTGPNGGHKQDQQYREYLCADQILFRNHHAV